MKNQIVPTLEVLVAGDQGNGKTNFINRFLRCYPPSAEVHRKNDSTYFIYKLDSDFKINLHDVSNENIERNLFEKMDVVVFCYSASAPESLQSLEKWFRLISEAVEKKEMRSLQTKKGMYSFLVADMSNLGSRRDVSNRLAEEANKLKEIFGIDRFIESSFEDDESASSTFQAILNELFPLTLNGKSFGKYKTFSDLKGDSFRLLTSHSNEVSSKYLQYCGDRDFEKIFQYANLHDLEEYF